MSGSRDMPRGIKVIIGFHILSFVLWLFGQTGAIIAYDTVAAWGLQEPRTLVDPVIVEVNRAIGFTDTVIMLPLFIIAVIGLLCMRFYGAVVSWLVFGMTLYWPVVYWSSQTFYGQAGIKHLPIPIENILLPGVLMLIAGWGTWYLAAERRRFR